MAWVACTDPLEEGTCEVAHQTEVGGGVREDGEGAHEKEG